MYEQKIYCASLRREWDCAVKYSEISRLGAQVYTWQMKIWSFEALVVGFSAQFARARARGKRNSFFLAIQVYVFPLAIVLAELVPFPLPKWLMQLLSSGWTFDCYTSVDNWIVFAVTPAKMTAFCQLSGHIISALCEYLLPGIVRDFIGMAVWVNSDWQCHSAIVHTLLGP